MLPNRAQAWPRPYVHNRPQDEKGRVFTGDRCARSRFGSLITKSSKQASHMAAAAGLP